MNFIDHPLEIIETIIKYINLEDLFCLSFVSKYLLYITRNTKWHHILIQSRNIKFMNRSILDTDMFDPHTVIHMGDCALVCQRFLIIGT